jgi:hypothetical protein
MLVSREPWLSYERQSVFTEKDFQALELADDQGSVSPGTSQSEHINQLRATSEFHEQMVGTYQALQT